MNVSCAPTPEDTSNACCSSLFNNYVHLQRGFNDKGCVCGHIHHSGRILRSFLPEYTIVESLCWCSVLVFRRFTLSWYFRFSSGDLSSECEENEVDPYVGQKPPSATTSQPTQRQGPPAGPPPAPSGKSLHNREMYFVKNSSCHTLKCMRYN